VLEDTDSIDGRLYVMCPHQGGAFLEQGHGDGKTAGKPLLWFLVQQGADETLPGDRGKERAVVPEELIETAAEFPVVVNRAEGGPQADTGVENIVVDTRRIAALSQMSSGGSSGIVFSPLGRSPGRPRTSTTAASNSSRSNGFSR